MLDNKKKRIAYNKEAIKEIQELVRRSGETDKVRAMSGIACRIGIADRIKHITEEENKKKSNSVTTDIFKEPTNKQQKRTAHRKIVQNVAKRPATKAVQELVVHRKVSTISGKSAFTDAVINKRSQKVISGMACAFKN